MGRSYGFLRIFKYTDNGLGNWPLMVRASPKGLEIVGKLLGKYEKNATLDLTHDPIVVFFGPFYQY